MVRDGRGYGKGEGGKGLREKCEERGKGWERCDREGGLEWG